LLEGFGVQTWHDFASRFVVRDLVLKDVVYPHLYTRDGVDITTDSPTFMDYAGADHLRVAGGRMNPWGYQPIVRVNVPLLFEHELGSTVVSHCHVSTTDEPGDLVFGAASFSSRTEITDSEIDIPSPGGGGINILGSGHTVVRNNRIAVTETGAGLWIEGSNGIYEGNDYTQCAHPGWSAALAPPSDVRLTGHGCVMSWFETRNNVFDEWRLPVVNGAGTTACEQILDLGSNDILDGDQSLHCDALQGTALLRQYFNQHRAGLETRAGRLRRGRE